MQAVMIIILTQAPPVAYVAAVPLALAAVWSLGQALKAATGR